MQIVGYHCVFVLGIAIGWAHALNSRVVRIRHLSPSLNAVNAGGVIDKLTAKNAEMLAVKEMKATQSPKQLGRASLDIVNGKSTTLARLLEREGCVSVPGVVSHETCDALSAYINAENERLTSIVSEKSGVDQQFLFDEYFGGVNCRGTGKVATRQDMFLPLSNDIVRKGLKEAFTSLLPLLKETVTLDGMIHEYPESYMDPLYTVFVALQDIDDTMGHTIFYPRTHTPETHLMWNAAQKKASSPAFIKNLKSVQSSLKKGDVSIFDSRLLHCGDSNDSEKRRLLFYFTVSKQEYWPLQGGLHGANSIRSIDRYSTRIKDILS